MRRLQSILLPLALALAAVIFTPATSSAQDLSDALEDLVWGDSHEQVLEYYRDQVLEQYRADIAGLNDAIQIDRIRRASDDTYEEIEESYEEFNSGRTGYEVSVLRGEVAPSRDQSMLTVRDGENTRYYVFENDALVKLIVVYDLESVNFVGFEGFVERVEQLFGRPDTSDYEEDDLGRRMLTRATWNDGYTRMRIEDRSGMFSSYLLVYTDAEAEDDYNAEGASIASSRGRGRGRDLGSMVQELEQTDSSTNRNVVDSIIGSSTDVNLTPGRPQSEAAVVAARSGPSPLDDTEIFEDAPRLERSRPSRSSSGSGSSGSSSDDDGDDGDGGLTIY